MQTFQKWSLAILVSISLVITGCGGGGGGGSSAGGNTGSPGDSVEISGLASAPAGTVARLEPKRFPELALAMLVSPVAAAITGLEPIEGADVELIRVDNNGDQVGDVLATSKTSSTGHYTLTLPADVDLSGNLVVRIGATATEQIRAQVVSRSVNISPVSEYVLRKFIERGADLESLALNTVVTLSGKVEEFDIAATAGNLDALLERLEQDAGELMNSQVDLAVSEPAAATALDGGYMSTNLTLVLGDYDDGSTGSFETQIFRDGFVLEAQGPGNVDVEIFGGDTLFAQLFGADNASGIVRGGLDLGDGGSETLPATYTDNNVLTIQAPFSEEVEPDNGTGYRSPPTDFRIQPVPAMGLMFAAPSEILVRYALNDADAIDAEQKLGEELKRGLETFVRTPTSATTADLDGTFGRVYLGTIISDDAWLIEAEAEANTITFDGANGLAENTGTNRYMLTRHNDRRVNLRTEVAGTDQDIPFEVSSLGAITFDGGDAPTGYINDSFNFIAEANLDEAYDEQDSLIGPFLSKTLLLKLPETRPAISGKRYRILSTGIGVNLGGAGNISLVGSRYDSSFEVGTLTAGEGTAERKLSLSVVTKPALDSQVYVSNLETTQTADVTVGENGATTMTVVSDSSTTVYEGFFNGDGSLGIFMARVASGDASPNQLALAVLAEQP